ncbi:hypothetical protein LMG28727_06271 [Paraburkholderia kirstenboschensis]|uniref:hypothetical protein n=1 Tax=Paraburkholderia kirstenboschensis TaxID=1245436 RepID=UPI000FFB3155|nr:hypothetical protein [Paraburkholderia kirstenboschensis]CAD6557081.1 hypothetical protein LMG28727_06271 [Paraburkholderia kirstenboschensis]
MTRRSKCIAALTTAAISGWALASDSPPGDSGGQWQIAVGPYLWLPTVSGTLRFTVPGGGVDDASSGRYNHLQDLRFALMLQGEARKGEWGVFADTIYLNFGRHDSSVNATSGVLGTRETQQDAQTSFAGTLVQLGGSRTVVRQEWGHVDAIAGLRYLGVKGTLDAAIGTTGGSGPGASSDFHVAQMQNIFDGFAGVRGRANITEDGAWYIPFYLDVGTGSSKLTWQALTGLAYAAKWVDVGLLYRYLAFYGSGNQLVQTLRFSGPSLNVTFKF